MNKSLDEDPFAKNAQSISRIYHEVLLLMKVLQTKPQNKNMNINNYELYYTAIKNRDEKENADNQYENADNKSSDIIILYHKTRETILK